MRIIINTFVSDGPVIEELLIESGFYSKNFDVSVYSACRGVCIAVMYETQSPLIAIGI